MKIKFGPHMAEELKPTAAEWVSRLMGEGPDLLDELGDARTVEEIAERVASLATANALREFASATIVMANEAIESAANLDQGVEPLEGFADGAGVLTDAALACVEADHEKDLAFLEGEVNRRGP